jgi:hypothetical protein
VCRKEQAVLIIIELSAAAIADPISLRTLETMAAVEELVFVCPHDAVAGTVVPALRRALPRCQIVALLVDDGVSPCERELVKDLLEEGRVPLILTTQDPSAELAWLDADVRIALPDPAPVANR